MNIKSRLSFQFTLVIGFVVIFSSVFIYYFASVSLKNKYFEFLAGRARANAILLINNAGINDSLRSRIQQLALVRDKQEIAVTDSAYHMIFRQNIDYLNEENLRKNSIEGSQLYFSIREKVGVGYRHQFRGHTYFIYIMEYDKFRGEFLFDLRLILLWSSVIGIFLAMLLSYFFSMNALRPVSEIINQVKQINYSMLHRRLNQSNTKDELAQLSSTLNEMLAELENSMKNQKDFIAHASHQLRTPLSIMIGESDFILDRKRDPGEYIRHIETMLEDLKKLNREVNTLLELAQVNKENAIKIADERLDEIIFSSIKAVKPKYPAIKIIPDIRYPDDGKELLVRGNFDMLAIAFRNIIDNACKFSSENVMIEVFRLNRMIHVKITDKGVGIPGDEIDRIFIPFNRASNVKFISGLGVGLSISEKILDIHRASVSVHSVVNEGTVFEIRFEAA